MEANRLCAMVGAALQPARIESWLSPRKSIAVFKVQSLSPARKLSSKRRIGSNAPSSK